ncbi:MAG TPA: serine/threonine-protein kinase, partial [Candidatus Sulfopaludibacter sp.]|nr:serine/threonine-protein kinase [Candidatus Sulfopaludibacter sp.]
MVLDVGTQVGDYRILSRIGKGVYGIVFEAEHIITQRVDALKLMLDAACPADDEQRFLREIQVQASLQHPNIATVHTAFRSPYGLALVMERVDGESLRAIQDRGRLPLALGVRYVLETLAGLDYAERHGVIHRDVKPENILITPEGDVKLTDFGLAHVMNLARLTGSGESLGTPLYMSPEQIDGMGEVDARSDVYSTGVVLYEAVTGRAPFSGTNGFAVMRAHREMQPPPPMDLEPAVGAQLNTVILKALEKDPAKRFQSSAAFHAALRQAIAPAPVAAPPRVSRRPRFAAVLLVGLGAAGATLASGYWIFRQHPAPTVKARRIAAPAAAPAAEPAKAPPIAPPVAQEPVPREPPDAEPQPDGPVPARKRDRAPAARVSRAKPLRIGGFPKPVVTNQ